MSVFQDDCMIEQSNWSTDPCEWFLITWHTSPNTQPTHPHAAKKSTRNIRKKINSSFMAEISIEWKEGWTSQTKKKKNVDSTTFTFQIASATSSGKVLVTAGGNGVRGWASVSMCLAVGFVIISLNRFARSSVSIDRLPALEKVLFIMVFLFWASFLNILGVLIKTSSCNCSVWWLCTSASKIFNEEKYKKLLISIYRSCQF